MAHSKTLRAVGARASRGRLRRSGFSAPTFPARKAPAIVTEGTALGTIVAEGIALGTIVAEGIALGTNVPFSFDAL